MSPEYDKFTRFLILSYKIKKRKDQMYFLIFSYLIVIQARWLFIVGGRVLGKGILLAIQCFPREPTLRDPALPHKNAPCPPSNVCRVCVVGFSPLWGS